MPLWLAHSLPRGTQYSRVILRDMWSRAKTARLLRKGTAEPISISMCRASWLMKRLFSRYSMPSLHEHRHSTSAAEAREYTLFSCERN